MPASEIQKPNSIETWSRRDLLALLLAICPVLSLTIWWHSANYQLPEADRAGYLYTAQLISQTFDLDGILAGLKAIYWIRGWRPTILPALMAPFHWIAPDDVRVIFSIGSIFFTGLLCYWTYRCVRALLRPWRAALATICCTTIPYHYTFSFNFFS